MATAGLKKDHRIHQLRNRYAFIINGFGLICANPFASRPVKKPDIDIPPRKNAPDNRSVPDETQSTDRERDGRT
jgi:hypothetical protein